MTRKIQCLIVLLFFLGLLTVCRSEAYTYADPKARMQNDASEQNDPYLAKLLSQFPEHKKIFAKLYDANSGWIIPLVEKYGEAPLLAMNEAKESEYEALYQEQYADVFFDLYQTIASVKSNPKRAYMALRLTNAMKLTDPEQDYAEELERAKEADRRASRNGNPSRSYTDAFFAKGLFPDNLLTELKKEPDKYAVLMDAFAEADASVLETIAKYPNALTFLLNAGPAGVKLIEETNGEVVTLSYIMTNESQAALPALFKEHRLLAEALVSCGAQAFPIIMEAPNFYFALVSSFRGEISNRYFAAYVILERMLEAETAEGNKAARDFLNNLTREQTQRIAGLTAELLEKNESSKEEDAPPSVAPFSDPWYIPFIQKYDRDAYDICAAFGDLNMATLLMEDWQGYMRDVSPIIRAILEYNDDNAWGLYAAMTFKYNKHMQGVILSPEFNYRSKELFMFMFHDSYMHLSANIGSTENSAKKLLNDYRAESGTGRPVEKDGGKMQFVEFVPGYDLLKPLTEMAIYGKTPTVGDVVFAALDLTQLLPIGIGVATIAKSPSKAAGYITKAVTTLPGKLKGGVDDMVKNFGFKQLRRQAANAVDYLHNAWKVSKTDAWAILLKLRPNANTLSDLWSSARKFPAAAKSGIVYAARPIGEWFNNIRHLYPSLRSNPWMTKHATDAVVNGLVVESVMQPALFYTSTLSIFNYIETKQIPLKLAK